MTYTLFILPTRQVHVRVTCGIHFMDYDSGNINAACTSVRIVNGIRFVFHLFSVHIFWVIISKNIVVTFMYEE